MYYHKRHPCIKAYALFGVGDALGPQGCLSKGWKNVTQLVCKVEKKILNKDLNSLSP